MAKNQGDYWLNHWVTVKKLTVPVKTQLMYRRAAEELRAAAFNRTCTLRRFLAALTAHVTREKLREWDHQELAQKHSRRSACVTFNDTLVQRQASPFSLYIYFF